MLQLTIKGIELWDERKEEFIQIEDRIIQLEHSLISLQKWESKWKKSFLSKNEKTIEEMVDYVRCMTITPNVNPIVYNCLTREQWEEINRYIADTMTATTIVDLSAKTGKKEIITAEIIYYWMISFGIPFECRKWHLSQLLTLIQVFNVKNRPQKKRSQRDVLAEYKAINERRRKELGTKG